MLKPRDGFCIPPQYFLLFSKSTRQKPTQIPDFPTSFYPNITIGINFNIYITKKIVFCETGPCAALKKGFIFVENFEYLLLNYLKSLVNMNALKNVRSNMLTAVSELFKTDADAQTAYQHASALLEDLSDLNDILTALDPALEKSDVSTTPLTKAKDDLRVSTAAVAKNFIRIGTAHASQKNNPTLKNELFPFTKKLDKAKDSEFPIVCANLLKIIRTIAAEDLAKRGISSTDLKDFETQVATFKSSLSTNKGSRDETSTELSRAEQLTVAGCAIVTDRMTPTMLQIKDYIPAFFAKYGKASTIKKPATSSTQLNITVLDDTNNAVLEGGVIKAETLEKAAEKTGNKTGKTKSKANIKGQKSEFRTNVAGEATLKHTRNANLKTDILTIVREGYEPYQQPMPELKRGKTTNITVRLTPLGHSGQ